jgi:phospholipid-transporting ATPase
MVTSVKEGSEDMKRNKSDKFENNREVNVITFMEDGTMVETKKLSEDVNPGDIIKLSGAGPVPVDLLLIMTSMHGDGNKCYIETANLDGETNLKLRDAPAGLYDLYRDDVTAGRVIKELFAGSIEFDPPNKNMHHFVGTLKLHGKQEAVALGPSNVILRSSLFTNTDWAYGIAVYTGQETKIQMNNRKAPSKMSRLEHNLNNAIIIIFFAQIALVTVSVISIYIMGFENYNKKLPYVYPDGEGTGSVLPLWLDQW